MGPDCSWLDIPKFKFRLKLPGAAAASKGRYDRSRAEYSWGARVIRCAGSHIGLAYPRVVAGSLSYNLESDIKKNSGLDFKVTFGPLGLISGINISSGGSEEKKMVAVVCRCLGWNFRATVF